MVFSLNIDYKDLSCELCKIGGKYDTDKSSLRNNVTNTRHCHPYTLFYNSFFKKQRHEELKIAELGILDGASLLMWREYFSNSQIYGFEYNNLLINNFKKKFDNNRINLTNIDVTNKDSILNSLRDVNETYDIIIDDTTHQFEDQIRVIENIYSYLKPGGVLIIEDIFKSYNENDYIDKLQPILHHFQDYFFISLDHSRKNSYGWDNDKLFVLIKKGEEIFTNNKKITIITPSSRPDNLIEVQKSLNFNFIHEWIIVYDGSKITENPYLFTNHLNNDKISEYLYKGNGISGNSQRNFALENIKNKDTYLYYLDDDNIIHEDLYKILNIIGDQKFCTFDQKNRIKGDNIQVDKIDTAMFLIDFNLCKSIRWIEDKYNADGYYIKECYSDNNINWIYIDNDLSYYNYLQNF
jgi:predicted O-methyltransferase YrrM